MVGRKENREGRIEVRERAGKGEDLRELGSGKETAGGLWDGSNSYRREKRKVK